MMTIRSALRIAAYGALAMTMFLLSFFLGGNKTGGLHSGLASYVGIPIAEAETTQPPGRGVTGIGSGCSCSGGSTGSGGSGSACAS